MIEVLPDPSTARGGVAVLRLLDGPDLGPTAAVTVLDAYSGRYLGEQGNWQAEPVGFGPYPVRKSGKTQEVTVGTEIVNHIGEYTVVRIGMGSARAELPWPDTILPAPDGARIGGILAAGQRAAPPTGLRAELPPDPPGAVPGPVSDPAPQPPQPDPAPAVPPRRPFWPLLVATLVLAVAAAGTWIYLHQFEPTPPDPTPVAPQAPVAPAPVAPAPVAPAAACAATDLLALSDGTVLALQDRVRACGPGAASPDAVLPVIERLADRGDAAALLLLGAFYDAAVTDDVFETGAHLTFGDDPVVAADYYARAAAAGSAEARDRLRAVCRRLASATDTLSKSAVGEHCDE